MMCYDGATVRCDTVRLRSDTVRLIMDMHDRGVYMVAVGDLVVTTLIICFYSILFSSLSDPNSNEATS